MMRWIAGVLVFGLTVMPLWAAEDTPQNGGSGSAQTEEGAAQENAQEEAAAEESGGVADAPRVSARPGFEVRRAGVSSEWAMLDALGKEVPGAENVPLGDTGQPAPALYWPAVARKNEGGALVLTTVGGAIARRGLAQQLAKQLPEAGWHTLTTVLQAPVTPAPKRVLPARRDPVSSKSSEGEADEVTADSAPEGEASTRSETRQAAEGASETDGTAGTDAAEGDKPVDIDVVQGDAPAEASTEVVNAEESPGADAAEAQPSSGGEAGPEDALNNLTRLALALDELNRRGFQNNAVIAEGGEVPDVLAWLASLPDIPPKGLVLILVNAPLDSWAGWLEKQPALRQLAVLDIWGRDQSLLARQAALRLKSARRAGFRRYDVYPVSAPGLPGGQARLARKIVHWLRTVAPGEDRAVSAGGGA